MKRAPECVVSGARERKLVFDYLAGGAGTFAGSLSHVSMSARTAKLPVENCPERYRTFQDGLERNIVVEVVDVFLPAASWLGRAG